MMVLQMICLLRSNQRSNHFLFALFAFIRHFKWKSINCISFKWSSVVSNRFKFSFFFFVLILWFLDGILDLLDWLDKSSLSFFPVDNFIVPIEKNKTKQKNICLNVPWYSHSFQSLSVFKCMQCYLEHCCWRWSVVIKCLIILWKVLNLLLDIKKLIWMVGQWKAAGFRNVFCILCG